MTTSRHGDRTDTARTPLERVIDRVTADESLIPDTVHVLRERLPDYETVPDDAFAAAVRRNVALSRRWVIAEPHGGVPDRVPEAETLVAERRAQGVPVGTVIMGFRLCMTLIMERVIDAAQAEGLSAGEVVRVVTRLTELGDAFSTNILLANRQQDLARAAADAQERAAWVRDALITPMAATDLRRGALAHGLRPGEPVRAVRARAVPPRADSEAAADGVRRWAEARGVRALTSPRGDEVIAVAAGTFTGAAATDRDLLLAVGSAGPLTRVRDSFVEAGRILEAAALTGLRGEVDAERLGWRAALAVSPEVTDLLRRRHLEPLADAGEFAGQIVEALRAWLDHGLSITAAAASIPVHENTLRHRLRRFSDLTGQGLHDVDTIVELRWVLSLAALSDSTTGARRN